MSHLCISVYHFSLWLLLKLHTNYQILVSPQYGRWVAVPQGKTFIAYELFQTLHVCIRQIGGAFSESSTHWWVSTCHFPWLFTLKQHTKCQIISTLSVQKTGWCTERRDIHCLWSDCSNPFLDVCDRWKKLLTASVSHICVSMYHFSLWSIIKLHTNYQIIGSPVFHVTLMCYHDIEKYSWPWHTL